MSHLSSKDALGRTSPQQQSTSTGQLKSVESSTGLSSRKRTNTSKYGIHPPAIHLSLKSSARSTVDLSQEEVRTPRLASNRPREHSREPLHSSSIHSPTFTDRSYGRSVTSPSIHSMHSPKYGTHITTSPTTASPSSIATFPTESILSNSLPAMFSSLSAEPDLELVIPGSLSSHRRTPSREKPLSPYLHSQASLPHSYSNLRVPTATRAASAPSSRKSSLGSSDRDAGLHLDMKRLMSKPARPKHSGSSVISIPSDAELTSASSLSPRHQQRFYNLPVGGRPSSSGHVTDSAVASSARTLRVSASRASLHAAAYEAEQVQKSRNVLRRKTSARSNPATPTAATFKAAQTESINATPRKAGRSPDPPRSSAPRRTASATAEPVSVTRRHRTPPSGLTPAGAVAHAYKQQEQLREELSEVTGWNEYTRGQSLPDRSPLHEEDDEEASGAYYTVFGSTTGKVVAVGTAGDSSWDLTYDTQLGPEEQARLVTKVAAAGGSPAASHTSHGVRSLGRKVSGRFKKPAGSPPQRFAADTVREGWTPYDGRQSFQHDRRPVTPSKTKSSVPSLDEYVEVQASPSSIPSVPNGSTERSPRDREGRSLRAQRSHKPKELEKDEESPGGKLWKLMKRISTGGLRDKYVARDSSPPPVPALPKDFQHLVPSRTTFDIRPSSSHGNGTIPTEMSVMRFMNSRTSMSVVRPSTAPQKSSPRAEASSSRPSTGARPSTTTRSSSPMSSDIASSRFFNKTHSTRSSISSYGEELPPMPKAVGNHIMSPSELYKLNKDGEDPIKGPRRSKSRPRIRTEEATSPEDNQPRPSLRPPRRSGTGGKSAPSGDALPPSPVIPTFSTLEPINNFSPPSRLSLPTSEFGIMDESTPPRPKRSTRRKAVPSDSASSDLLTPISPPMPVTPRTPHSPNLPSISVDVSSLDGSHSSHSHSTARDGAQNVSPSSASSNPRSPLRFRELELSRSRLTEKEKADKWDDLLMRSDQAGGTLHIGETGLMSDNIRFSEYSEI